MKRHLSKLVMLIFIAGALITGSSTTASAQIYVHVRPTAPVVVRTERPSPRHVWIGEEWEARNGTYVHTGGRWAEPPHPGYVWVTGHWSHTDRGHVWRPGHWRRR